MIYGPIGDWKYNQYDGVYYWGTPNNGCGVYRRDDGRYTGNVIVQGSLTFLDNYPTLDDAKNVAVKLYKQLRREYWREIA